MCSSSECQQSSREWRWSPCAHRAGADPDTECPYLVLLLLALHVTLAGTVTGLCDENQPQSTCVPKTLVGRGTRMNLCSHQSLAPKEWILELIGLSLDTQDTPHPISAREQELGLGRNSGAYHWYTNLCDWKRGPECQLPRSGDAISTMAILKLSQSNWKRGGEGVRKEGKRRGEWGRRKERKGVREEEWGRKEEWRGEERGKGSRNGRAMKEEGMRKWWEEGRKVWREEEEGWKGRLWTMCGEYHTGRLLGLPDRHP